MLRNLKDPYPSLSLVFIRIIPHLHYPLRIRHLWRKRGGTGSTQDEGRRVVVVVVVVVVAGEGGVVSK